MTPSERELSELGKEALRIARAKREELEATKDLAEALRECAESVREMTRELERIRMDEERDLDEEWRAEA